MVIDPITKITRKNDNFGTQIIDYSIMNKVFLFILFLSLLSCKKDSKTVWVDMDSLPIDVVKPFTYSMTEIQNPYAMRLYQQHLIFLNTIKSGDFPFYIYSADSLTFQNTLGRFGRGPKDFYAINTLYWESTDSSFVINTNHFYRTEISLSQDSFTILNNDPISDRAMHNLLRINDSLILFETNRQEKEFVLYHSKTHQILNYFGDFPNSTISYTNLDDRDDLLEKSCIINRDSQIVAVFYLREPLIRFYDFNCQLIQEVKLKNREQAHISINEFYEEKENLFFLSPYSTSESIFVLFINANQNCTYHKQSTELQEWDWHGHLKRRFDIQASVDLFCISNDGTTFYGLQTRDEEFRILKANLNEK